MIAKRVKECVGLMMIGEGILAAVRPREYARFWASGPAWWHQIIEPFVKHPHMTRAVGVAEALAGYWLAVRQLPAQSAS
jgi:hypothetical protein